MSADPISAGLMIAGSLLGGIEERKAHRAQARVHDEAGRLDLLEGEQQIAATRHEERQAVGLDIAAMGESGVALGTGTALDLIQQSAMERETEIGNIRAQARGAANNEFVAAADERRAGKAALVGGIFKAAGAAVDYASASSANRRRAGLLDREAKARVGKPGGGAKGYVQNVPGRLGYRAPYQRLGDTFAPGPFGRLRVIMPPSD